MEAAEELGAGNKTARAQQMRGLNRRRRKFSCEGGGGEGGGDGAGGEGTLPATTTINGR